MKKKHMLVGIIVIALIGIGCFVISEHESDDVSANVKQENGIKTSEDVTGSTVISESKATQTQPKDNSSKTKETSTKHTHNWVAIYKGVDNGYYETVTSKTSWAQCNRCGADITSDPNGHLKMHLQNGETENVSWSTKYRYSEAKEWVPKIEKVVSYYKCSCGATK